MNEPNEIEQTQGDGKGFITSEGLLIRDTAREFTRREVLPVANRLDQEQGQIPRTLQQRVISDNLLGKSVLERRVLEQPVTAN